MSAVSVLHCDVDDCERTHTEPCAPLWTVRLRATTNAGWSTGDDGDLCPLHRLDEEAAA